MLFGRTFLGISGCLFYQSLEWTKKVFFVAVDVFDTRHYEYIFSFTRSILYGWSKNPSQSSAFLSSVNSPQKRSTEVIQCLPALTALEKTLYTRDFLLHLKDVSVQFINRSWHKRVYGVIDRFYIAFR